MRLLGQDFGSKAAHSPLVTCRLASMAEVGNLSPEASAPQAADERLKAEVCVAIKELLPQTDLAEVSLAEFRASLAEHLGFDSTVLEGDCKHQVNEWIRATLQSPAAAPQQHMAEVVQGLGAEETNFKHQAHLLTISRVLPGTLDSTDLRDIQAMSRQEVADCVRLAFDNPVYPPGTGGQRRSKADGLVQKLVVFQEEHSDGSKHFHVAVKLNRTRKWTTAKDRKSVV